MRYIVTLMVIVLSMGIAFAQSGGTKPQSKQSMSINKLLEKAEDAETVFQNYFDDNRNLNKVLNKQVKSIQERHKKVIEAYKSVIEEQGNQLVACQDTLSVYRFFSNTGETIFTDFTLERNGWSKKLTGTYLTQYKTISSIREASSAISEVENTINKMIDQQQEKGWDDEQLQTAIALEIGNRMKNSIVKQLNDINNMDLRFLSPEQEEYYRKLSGRFDKIFNTYF